jgi:hypothetical protein
LSVAFLFSNKQVILFEQWRKADLANSHLAFFSFSFNRRYSDEVLTKKGKKKKSYKREF